MRETGKWATKTRQQLSEVITGAVPFTSMITRVCFALVAGLLLAALAIPASAEPITGPIFSLSESDGRLGGLSGPFLDVTISQPNRPNQQFVTVTSRVVDGTIYLFDMFALNIPIPLVPTHVIDIVGANSGTGFTPGPFTLVNPPGSSTLVPFGDFDLVIESPGGFTHAINSLSFEIDGVSLNQALDLLLLNAQGFFAAAEIFATPFPADARNGAIATGFAACSDVGPTIDFELPNHVGVIECDGSGRQVPLPATSLLFVAGILFAGLGWRKGRGSK